MVRRTLARFVALIAAPDFSFKVGVVSFAPIACSTTLRAIVAKSLAFSSRWVMVCFDLLDRLGTPNHRTMPLYFLCIACDRLCKLTHYQEPSTQNDNVYRLTMNRRSFLSALAAVVLVPQAKFDPFASGRMPLGTWFGSFGSSMAATLHGTEAVITPEQAPIFMQNVRCDTIAPSGENQNQRLAL